MSEDHGIACVRPSWTVIPRPFAVPITVAASALAHSRRGSAVMLATVIIGPPLPDKDNPWTRAVGSGARRAPRIVISLPVVAEN
jgi:hypothetical protein